MNFLHNYEQHLLETNETTSGFFFCFFYHLYRHVQSETTADCASVKAALLVLVDVNSVIRC